jgi:Mg-chelatase subunit ChlI
VKGDRIEIVIDAGNDTKTYEVVATRAGRRLAVTHGRGFVEVTEVTRGGTPVRSARFMTGRVIAMVEHPASPALKLETDAPEEPADDRVPRLPGL